MEGVYYGNGRILYKTSKDYVPRNQKKSYELIKDLHEEVRHVNKAFARNFELGDGCEVVYLSICS